MEQIILNQIVWELENNKEEYLINCKKKYSDYVAAAQILFPEYYRSMHQYAWHNVLVEESIRFRKIEDVTSEQRILEKLFDMGTDVPYIYNRLAIIYSKLRQFEKAQMVCEKWFASVYWKIPNMSTTSFALLKRLQKLESKRAK